MASVKHHIVALDSWVQPPKFDFDYDLSLHVTITPEEIPAVAAPATIFITSMVRVTRDLVEAAPKLQLVACNGTGTDHIDKEVLRERGIALCHVPAQNTETVSEHAFALFFTLRRQILPMHKLVVEGDVWPNDTRMYKHFGQPPRTNGEETLVVVGYGALGKHVEKIGRALGMRVLIAERKGASDVRDGRTSFADCLKLGTLFILVAPLDSTTKNMFGTSEFSAMDPAALIINVGRGGVINEADLAEALRQGEIGGAGLDVFETEPASATNSPLVKQEIPNLILSPHLAWYSSKTINGTLATVKANIDGFVKGQPQNLVV